MVGGKFLGKKAERVAVGGVTPGLCSTSTTIVAVGSRDGSIDERSPLPMDSWEDGIGGGVDTGGSTRLDNDSSRRCGQVVVRWMNAVLDPWNTVYCGGDQTNNSHTYSDNDHVYRTHHVLKDRMMGQWRRRKQHHTTCTSNNNNAANWRDIVLGEGGLWMVKGIVVKDAIEVARRIDGVVHRCDCKDGGRRVFGMYSKVWLEVAHDVVRSEDGLSEKECAFVREHVFGLQLSCGHHAVMGTRGKTRSGVGKLTTQGYCRVVNHVLMAIAFLDEIFRTSREEKGKGENACRSASSGDITWRVPSWAPPLFTEGGVGSDDIVREAIGWMLLDGRDGSRYMKRYGYEMVYVQPAMHEVSYRVENVAVDIRDGRILCRLADVLCGGFNKIEAIYPATKVSERVENITMALAKLGLDTGDWSMEGTTSSTLSIAQRIAEGDERATMGVLWECILRYELNSSLNVHAIHMECEALWGQHSSYPCVRMGLSTRHHPAACAVLDWVLCLCKAYVCGDIIDLSLNTREDRVCVLESLLVHYGSGIKKSQRRDALAWRMSQPQGCVFDRVTLMLKSVGGMPSLISKNEYMGHGGTIDARMLTVFYALLCKRVLSLHVEERAARVIQRCWRAYSCCHESTKRPLDTWIDAARIIQRNVRPFLCRMRIEASAGERRLMVDRVTRLQAMWRGRRQRRIYCEMQEATVVIQKYWRMFVWNRWYGNVVAHMCLEAHAARVIQSHWRSHACSSKFVEIKYAALCIQRYWRMHVAHETFLREREAAVVIQSHVRAFLCNRMHATLDKAALRIQTVFRGYCAQNIYRRKVEASIMIQRNVRCLQAQRHVQQRHEAVVCIQKYYRAYRAQRLVQVALLMEERIQQFEESVREFSRRTAAACMIQTSWRDYMARMEQHRTAAALQMRRDEAARRIQAAFLGYRQRTWYNKRKDSCLKIQKAWREAQARKRLSLRILTMHEHVKKTLAMRDMYGSSVVTIQAYFRRYYVCKYHSNAETMKEVRERLEYATERAHVLIQEGLEDPTTLWNMTMHSIQCMKQGKRLPELEVLSDLHTCLHGSKTCCEGFVDQSGVEYLLTAILSVSRDRMRFDSVCRGFQCIEALSSCGRYVDRVTDVVVSCGYLHELANVLFQFREHQVSGSCCFF